MERRLRIFLGDLNYRNRLNRSTRHMPKNVGYLAAYSDKLYGSDVDISLFKEVDAFVEALGGQRPDVVGLSFYAWNTSLNHAVTRMVRQRYGRDVAVVWGGPSVDTDHAEQRRLFERFPEVDAFVANEGELGFAALIGRLLSTDRPWERPIDGIVHATASGELLRGREVGLSADLAEIPSPYLTGFMDPFMTGGLLPGIQTSRLCPYTCSFCASGKNRGKLRGFPIEQVKAELDYICRALADRPQLEMHINDENFGILSRDAEIAEYIVKCRETWGYPQSLFFYHDKRLNETTRHVLKSLASFSVNGVTIPLQTENPEALLAAKRKPVSPEDIAKVVDWASENDLQVTTELIFGLPGETADGFMATLDESIRRGFDSVLCNHLFIIDGIEINRASEREALGIQTKYRQVRDNYGEVDGVFTAEVEEVVVGTKSFDLTGFLKVRRLGMMFYACFNMRFQYWAFSHLKHYSLSVAEVMQRLVDKDAGQGPRQHFSEEFERAALGELHDSRADVENKLRALFRGNGNDVVDAAQLNISFGSRLIYEEGEWLEAALIEAVGARLPAEALRMLTMLMELYRRERIDLYSSEVPEPMEVGWDVLAWRRDKFRAPLADYRFDRPRRVSFASKPAFVAKFGHLRQEFAACGPRDFYVNILLNIGARSDLLYELAYLPD